MPVFTLNQNVRFNFYGTEYAGTVSAIEGPADNPVKYKVLVRQRIVKDKDGKELLVHAAQDTFELLPRQVEENSPRAGAGFA